jgi:lipopolysaccharide transport system ATP-binding protein
LLDLGAGFHLDLTGRENVYVSGVISGLTHDQVAERFDAIVEFAELEAFIDSPLRTYSTGMQMRLGFSVAIHTEPEVLLIDEVLAVGDLAFQRKCIDRIEQFRADGCTIMLVSHDASLIQRLCDDALWLRRGQTVEYGSAKAVAQRYMEEMAVETRRRTPETRRSVRTSSETELRIKENRFGSLEMEIVTVRLLDRDGYPIAELGSGDPLFVEIEYKAPSHIPNPISSVTISQEDGTVCYDTATDGAGYSAFSEWAGLYLFSDRSPRSDWRSVLH